MPAQLSAQGVAAHVFEKPKAQAPGLLSSDEHGEGEDQCAEVLCHPRERSIRETDWQAAGKELPHHG
jgi:hypothetical protein